MMAENDTPGYRFSPFDRELILDYLKPKIMKQKFPCNMIKEKEVYGLSLKLNPWRVFDTNDRDCWFRWPGLKETEKCTFVFVKLCKISKSNTSTSKNTLKKAGCGTWVGKGKKQDQIVDSQGKVIGEKRYLVFEINDIDSLEAGIDLSKIGHYKMHEYSLIGDDADLNSAGSMVLCRITYDSSKECPVNLKPGTKSANHISTSREAQNKEENNTNNFEGAGIVTVENLTPLYSGVSVDENLEQSRTLTAKDLDVIDNGVRGNLEGSRSLTSESLVAINSDVSDPFAAAPQYNNGLQELNNFGEGFGLDDLAGLDFGEGFGLDDLAGLDFGEGFGFDDLGGLDFCLDGLDVCDFRACLDPNIQEEPSRDSSGRKLKRDFEYEENLYQSKKMCLANPN